MLALILRYGVIAGVIVVAPMLWQWLGLKPGGSPPESLLLGYTIMLVALTVVFLGIKQYRDKFKGGVVKFLPAFGVGLAISVVACVFYALGWEIVTAYGSFDFTAFWSKHLIDEAKAAGKSGAELQGVIEQANAFAESYRKPWVRIPLTFAEMFPVGLLVSLISAAVLRNSRILPARRTLQGAP
jgi:hypothetical protein